MKKAVYGCQGVSRRERPAFLLPTAGLLCLPCDKCCLVLLIVEAFQTRWIKTSGQRLDDFVQAANLLFRSTYSVDAGSWNPKCGKAGRHPLKDRKFTNKNRKKLFSLTCLSKQLSTSLSLSYNLYFYMDFRH